MKFKVNSYHYNLLKDHERLLAFKEAICDFSKDRQSADEKTAFDLGCGSGVMSYFASSYFDRIISIEKEPKIASLAKENLADFKNIEVVSGDALDYDFESKADLIICEMLDTALIDEEEVPVLNHARRFLKEGGRIIPQSLINIAEPVYMENPRIQYEDLDSHPKYEVLGDHVVYSDFDFLECIEESFSADINFTLFEEEFLNSKEPEDKKFTEKDEEFSNSKNYADNDLMEKSQYVKVNGIKITSFARLGENLICGPTPMLNPAILVPIEEIRLKAGESFEITLSYVMGGGIETIETRLKNGAGQGFSE